MTAFVPISQSVVFINDLITSMLLLSQYAIVGWRAILVLAVGYLLTALLAIIYLLSFPGVFAPTGLLGAGLQTTAWLWVFWHAVFPIAVILYVVLKDDGPATISLHNSRRPVIAACLVFSVALVVALTWISTAGEPYLPVLLDPTPSVPQVRLVDHIEPAEADVVGLVLLLGIVALFCLWLWKRTVLDLWLIVALCAWSAEIITTFLSGGRFTLGFYVARGYMVIASMSVLIVLLCETMALYVRLAVAALETDFAHVNRVSMMGELAASLAHEILQPIATARNNARVGMRILEMSPPNLDEAKEAVACIVRDADRAKDIVDRMRNQIKKAPPRREPFDLNEAVSEVIALARSDIVRNSVSVQTRLVDGTFLVQGDRVQVQQVILNLVLNAVQAMGSDDGRARELLVSIEDHTGALIAVRDSGPGIDRADLERVFEAFYTTKASGTGMGLSICRSIIEAHGGRLWAEANAPCGAAFLFTLPTVEQDELFKSSTATQAGGEASHFRNVAFRTAE
jgi:signal transduction histidine kinase